MGGQYTRFMARCGTCSNLWSVAPDERSTARCPCGGELAEVDTQAEAMRRPYIPMKPESPKPK